MEPVVESIRQGLQARQLKLRRRKLLEIAAKDGKVEADGEPLHGVVAEDRSIGLAQQRNCRLVLSHLFEHLGFADQERGLLSPAVESKGAVEERSGLFEVSFVSKQGGLEL
jgi:hypothetical protein